MRLLIINPNTSERVSQLILGAARLSALEGTELRVVTAPFGSPSIESNAETTIAAHAVLTALAQNWRTNDAVIVAAFSDPGLAAAREISPIPVFGLAESALKAAALHGRSFSILTLGPHLEPDIRRQTELYSLSAQLVSVEFLQATIDELSRDQDALAGAVADLGRVAVSRGADALVLGGGPFSGLGRVVGPAVTVPVVDGIAAAVQQAEQSQAERGGYPSSSDTGPASKAYKGVDPELIILLEQMRISRARSPSRE